MFWWNACMVQHTVGNAKDEALPTSGCQCFCRGDVFFCRSYDYKWLCISPCCVSLVPLCSHGNVRGVNMRAATHQNDSIKNRWGLRLNITVGPTSLSKCDNHKLIDRWSMPRHIYICVSDEESVEGNSEADFSFDTFAYISLITHHRACCYLNWPTTENTETLAPLQSPKAS